MYIARLCTEAERGGADAQIRLGLCFAVGDRAGEGPAETVASYRAATERGDVLAPFSLGSCHFNQTSEVSAPLEILPWHHEAAQHGVADGQRGADAVNGRPGGGASAIRAPRTPEGAATVSAGLLNHVDPTRASRARSWAEF